METLWGSALWRQFGATIETLDHVLLACPEELWQERLWPSPPEPPFPPQFAEFWYVSYHTLVWLDLYLTGLPEEEFAPPLHFAQGELDTVESTPAQPYSKELLREYLATLRQKAHDTLAPLTDEQARRSVEYPWSEGQSIGYGELQLYNLRHAQEHVGQLSLFLGQRGIPDEQLVAVTRATNDG